MSRFHVSLTLLLALLAGVVAGLEPDAGALSESTLHDRPGLSSAPPPADRQPFVRRKVSAPRQLEVSFATLRERILITFTGKVPREWGENVTGVKTKVRTEANVIALTFDACGGKKGKGYDASLIDFLTREKIPATLFLSGKWMDENPEASKRLAGNPLFEIANHGLNHKPCSINGRSAHGIQGTRNIDEMIDEIEQNGRKIAILTGRKPRLYRPGSGFCDEYGVKIARALGYDVAGYSVIGDGGASFSRGDVRNALLGAPAGSIVILHMNQPAGETAEGLMAAVPELRKKGVEFVKLSDHPIQ